MMLLKVQVKVCSACVHVTVTHTHTLIKMDTTGTVLKVCSRRSFCQQPLAVRCVCDSECVCLLGNFSIEPIIKTLMAPNACLLENQGLDVCMRMCLRTETFGKAEVTHSLSAGVVICLDCLRD